MQVDDKPRAPLPYGYAASPATALALAFVAAVRAERAEGDR